MGRHQSACHIGVSLSLVIVDQFLSPKVRLKQSIYWNIGLSRHWAAGPSGCQSIGLSENKAVGILGCRNMGHHDCADDFIFRLWLHTDLMLGEKFYVLVLVCEIPDESRCYNRDMRPLSVFYSWLTHTHTYTLT